MSIYRKEFTVTGRDVCVHRTMRPSSLLQVMQEAAGEHSAALGVGNDKTIDRGILWMVTHHYIKIERMPEYSETLTLETWVGKTRHVLFPRYSRIIDAQGNILVNASSIWVLADSKSRSLVSPAKAGIDMPPELAGGEAPLPGRIAERETTDSTRFKVPYSYVDINGHMNNARYFDLAEDCIPAAAEGRRLLELRAEYHSELRLNQEARIKWGCTDGEYYLRGEDEKLFFVLTMKYE